MVSVAQSWEEHPHRVVTTSRVTPYIRELWLTPSDGPLAYQPGQYVLLCDTAHQLPPRAYSIANASRPDGQVSLLVTRFPHGPISGWVHGVLQAGDVVALTGPYGTFVLGDERHCPVLLLAAGSGLAPVRALAEALLADAPARSVTLFFSARTAADTINDARFQDWTCIHPNFRYLLALTREPSAPLHQRIPDLLPDTLGSLCGWEMFAAGPPGFVTGCAAVAEKLGAERAAIHTEEFFADPQPWTGIPPKPARQSVGR